MPCGGCHKFLYLPFLISTPKKAPPDTVLSAAHPLEVMKLSLPGLTLKESIFSVIFSCFCSLPVWILSSVEVLYHSDDIKPETSGKKAGLSSNPSELLQCLKHPSGRQRPSSELQCRHAAAGLAAEEQIGAVWRQRALLPSGCWGSVGAGAEPAG